MADCNPHDCPVSVRVDALESEFNRYRSASSNTHQKMFDRIGALEQNRAANSTKLDTIEGKIDTLISWREEQDNKPNQLIDHLKENAINYLMLAMMGMMLLKMGFGS